MQLRHRQMFLLRLGLSLFVFLVIFSSGILYTFNQTKIYRASGMLEIHDPRPVQALSLEDVLKTSPPSTAENEDAAIKDEQSAQAHMDLKTAFSVLGSRSILMGVEQRIQGELRQRFMAPYLASAELTGPLSPMEVLEANRSLEMVPDSRNFLVHYNHPDPIVAAEVVNRFMKEFIDDTLKREIDAYMRMTEDLRIRIDNLDRNIEELNARIEAFNQDTDSATELRLLLDEREVLIQFRAEIYRAFTESKLRVNIVNPRARIVDAAMPPYEDQPYQPNVEKNLYVFLLLGLLAALIPHLFSRFRA